MGEELPLLPETQPNDDEDVVWGLQTATALWARGERREALTWVRRAAEAAGSAGDDGRAVELAKRAISMEEYIAAIDAAPPETPHPKPLISFPESSGGTPPAAPTLPTGQTLLLEAPTNPSFDISDERTSDYQGELDPINDRASIPVLLDDEGSGDDASSDELTVPLLNIAQLQRALDGRQAPPPPPLPHAAPPPSSTTLPRGPSKTPAMGISSMPTVVPSAGPPPSVPPPSMPPASALRPARTPPMGQPAARSSQDNKTVPEMAAYTGPVATPPVGPGNTPPMPGVRSSGSTASMRAISPFGNVGSGATSQRPPAMQPSSGGPTSAPSSASFPAVASPVSSATPAGAGHETDGAAPTSASSVRFASKAPPAPPGRGRAPTVQPGQQPTLPSTTTVLPAVVVAPLPASPAVPPPASAAPVSSTPAAAGPTSGNNGASAPVSTAGTGAPTGSPAQPSLSSTQQGVSALATTGVQLARKKSRAPILDPWADDFPVDDIAPNTRQTSHAVEAGPSSDDDVFTSAPPLDTTLRRKPPPPLPRPRAPGTVLAEAPPASAAEPGKADGAGARPPPPPPPRKITLTGQPNPLYEGEIEGEAKSERRSLPPPPPVSAEPRAASPEPPAVRAEPASAPSPVPSEAAPGEREVAASSAGAIARSDTGAKPETARTTEGAAKSEPPPAPVRRTSPPPAPERRPGTSTPVPREPTPAEVESARPRSAAQPPRPLFGAELEPPSRTSPEDRHGTSPPPAPTRVSAPPPQSGVAPAPTAAPVPSGSAGASTSSTPASSVPPPPAPALRPPTIPPAPVAPRIEAAPAAPVKTASVPPLAPSEAPRADRASSIPPGDRAVAGIPLDRIEAFADLPSEPQRALARSAELTTLADGDETQGFGLLLVTSGAVEVCATIADIGAAQAGSGALVSAFTSIADTVSIRVVAQGNAGVASFPREVVEEALRSCPWVLDELVRAGDRFAALAGATMGPLGDLDDESRRVILERFRVRALRAGELLAAKGSDNQGLLVVGAGTVVAPESGDTSSSGDLLFPDTVLDGSPTPHDLRAGEGGALVLSATRSTTVELFSTMPMLLEALRVS